MDNHDYALKIARLVIPDMSQHKVSPTPENYALWYHYTAGRDKALIAEIHALKEADKTFTPELCQRLYDTHILKLAPERHLQEQNSTAHDLMQDLMVLVGVMNDETVSYNRK